MLIIPWRNDTVAVCNSVFISDQIRMIDYQISVHEATVAGRNDLVYCSCFTGANDSCHWHPDFCVEGVQYCPLSMFKSLWYILLFIISSRSSRAILSTEPAFLMQIWSCCPNRWLQNRLHPPPQTCRRYATALCRHWRTLASLRSIVCSVPSYWQHQCCIFCSVYNRNHLCFNLKYRQHRVIPISVRLSSEDRRQIYFTTDALIDKMDLPRKTWQQFYLIQSQRRSTALLKRHRFHNTRRVKNAKCRNSKPYS